MSSWGRSGRQWDNAEGNPGDGDDVGVRKMTLKRRTGGTNPSSEVLAGDTTGRKQRVYESGQKQQKWQVYITKYCGHE